MVDETKIVPDTWHTFTVDISDIADTCTEFAFLVAQGNTVYLFSLGQYEVIKRADATSRCGSLAEGAPSKTVEE